MKINLPEEYVNRMKNQLKDDYDEFVISLDAPYVKSLRVNPLKFTKEDYLKLVLNEGRAGDSVNSGNFRNCGDFDNSENTGCCVPWEPNGIYYREASDDECPGECAAIDSPGKSPLHAAGAYYIQEASAMLPVTLLGADSSGQRILDLCAAPGGKSTQISSYMNGRGLLVSNEIVSSRAVILSENIERMGVTNALVVSEEPDRLADRFASFFDRILVDAPCSGEGMFRKHPEAALEWSEENVKMCADRQNMILNAAARMLAPGGKIVYSTCTFSPDEDEGTVERFLASHPEFEICDEPAHLYPHRERGEGHFAVGFARRGECAASLENPAGNHGVPENGDGNQVNREDGRRNREDKRRRAQKKSTGVLSAAEKDLLRDFAKTVLTEKCRFYEELTGDSFDRLLRFGDSIYLMPEGMTDEPGYCNCAAASGLISGLKVLRAGLKIGEFRKQRFEPDHAFAAALKKDEVRLYADYDQDSQEIKGYLTGMTLTADRAASRTGDAPLKGWCLVCVEGISLGWGKIAGGVIKNHYPRGLRTN